MERPLVNGWESYQRHRAEIEQLLDPNLYTIGWLDGQIFAGVFHIIANERAVIVVEIKTFPAGGREVHGMVAAGDLDAILPLIEQAEDWGRQHGCIYGTIASREGWARVMAPYGYEVDQVTIRKVL